MHTTSLTDIQYIIGSSVSMTCMILSKFLQVSGKKKRRVFEGLRKGLKFAHKN